MEVETLPWESEDTARSRRVLARSPARAAHQNRYWAPMPIVVWSSCLIFPEVTT